MINAVELVNFKNFRQQRVELGRLTVFVGANGSGKTTVLEAIDLGVRAARRFGRRMAADGQQLFEGEPRPALTFRGDKHCDWLYCRGGAGDMRLMCEMSRGETFVVAATPPDPWPPPIEEMGKSKWTFRVTAADGSVWAGLVPSARSLVFLRLNAAVMSKPSYSRVARPRVGRDGSNLATVLAFMALNTPDAFTDLVAEMRRLLPSLKRIRFTREEVTEQVQELLRVGDQTVTRPYVRKQQGDALLFDFDHANDVSARTASEGTLLLLGLLAVLMGPTKPRILLLDDLEHGLHPFVQRQVLDVLRRLMERFPDLQVIATAHSPYLLDGLRPEEVRLTTMGTDGYSICGRLTDHPQFSKWRDEMAPGELWSLFGEKWLAQGGGPP